jgi:2-keto-3-deoxy-L-rhamnonate aldolase RhmA
MNDRVEGAAQCSVLHSRSLARVSRMFDRLEAGEPALGTITLLSSPEWVEIMGNVGLDFAVIDMMITATDWGTAAAMIRAAREFDLTPWIRLQAYPWGSADAGSRLTADVLRALSIGAEVVIMSIRTPAELAEALHPASDWHRRVHLVDPEATMAAGDESPAKLEALRARRGAATIVAPFVESLSAVQAIDEICAVEGLKAIVLGMGDLSRQLGHAGEPTHPELLALVERVAAAAAARGIVVCAGTTRIDRSQTVAEVARLYWDLGVQMIWLPEVEYTAQRTYAGLLELVRGALPVPPGARDRG